MFVIEPLRSVAPATLPMGCGSPQTIAAAAVHGPEQERQIAVRRSGLEPRIDRSPQWRLHGCAPFLKTSFLPCASVTLYARAPRDSAEAVAACGGRHGQGRTVRRLGDLRRAAWLCRHASRAASAGHSALARG